MIQQLPSDAAAAVRGNLIGTQIAADPLFSDRRSAIQPLREFLAAKDSTRAKYDVQRPNGAPSSASLVRWYGTWRHACAAAERQGQSPGSHDYGSPHRQARHHRSRPYTKSEVINALWRATQDLGSPPTQATYLRWYTHQRANVPSSRWPPSLATVYRVLATDIGGWRMALSLAIAARSPVPRRD
jgi:hypothetical protein